MLRCLPTRATQEYLEEGRRHFRARWSGTHHPGHAASLCRPHRPPVCTLSPHPDAFRHTATPTHPLAHSTRPLSVRTGRNGIHRCFKQLGQVWVPLLAPAPVREPSGASVTCSSDTTKLTLRRKCSNHGKWLRAGKSTGGQASWLEESKESTKSIPSAGM